jgi:hypothetical protein
VERSQHRRSVHIETIERRRVSNRIADVTNHFPNVEQRRCRYLAADDQKPHRHVALAGDARLRIASQAFVQNGVGDLVAEFVRMTFGHRFGGEKHVLWEHRHRVSFDGSTATVPTVRYIRHENHARRFNDLVLLSRRMQIDHAKWQCLYLT